MNLSYTEENYIKAIYKLSVDKKMATTNLIAEEMRTSAASVSDMLKKLASKKLIDYRKYQGVKLTNSGKNTALQIIRKHRLWEVFLVEKLNFNWDEVHDIAEQLEHIKSPLLIQRLDEHLGFPEFDPHGDPIPDENGNISAKHKSILSQCSVGMEAIVVSLKNSDDTLLKYLDKIGIYIGVKIKIIDRINFDNSLEIQIDKKNKINISNLIAESIYISN